ncbi:glucose transport protein-like [Anopheles aquasalis]|uniref:glucose transport protein-like n=1 Tax=Anopheles aquasalis TaxID=42839 RepID=UPI00215A5DD1|nr:glucose transport protein-like [Anopheles aquasalis]
MQKSKRQRLGHRARTVLYTLVVSLSYVGAGAMVGWSGSGLHHSPPGEPDQLTNGTISLIAIPAAVLTVTACLVHRWYRWIGTKGFLLAAGLLGVCSATLEALATTFWWASASRILAGIAAGITFTLVPGYVADFDGDGGGGGGTEPNSGLLRVLVDELVAAAFPLGVLLRFLVVLLPVPSGLNAGAALCGTVSALVFFLTGLLLPESPRYLCATGQVERAAVALERTYPSADQPTGRQSMDGVIARWQLPAALGHRPPGLLGAVVRQGNLMLLVPLLALFAFQASVGAVPLLFYLHDVLYQLGIGNGAGGPSAGTVAAGLAAIFTFTGPLVSWLARHRHRSGTYPHRTLLLGTTVLMALTMLALGWHCHVRGTHSHLPNHFVAGQPSGSIVALALFYACHAIGFQRVPWALLEAEVQPDLRFPVRTLATVISWAMVYLTVRLFPILLRTIGIGWLFWNVALVALFAVAVLILTLPRDHYAGHRKLGSDRSSTGSSSTAGYCPRPCAHCAVCSVGVVPSVVLPVATNQPAGV